jgi:DNA repair exonuclease SbcCD ATPase subunit
MILKEWGWRNFLQYGNKMQSIKLNEKNELILILGDNAVGKTSIANSLSFALYGKTNSRKIKNLSNWFNKAAHTYVKYDTESGKKIECHRGISPDFVDLLIDGTAENIAGKPNINLYIENNLVNIPFTVFSNTLMLSMQDFKSFLRMDANDKRKIVDKIYDVSDLDGMHELCKADIRALSEDKSKLDNELNVMTNTLETINSQYEEALEKKRSVDEAEIFRLKDEKNKLERSIRYAENNISELNRLKSAVDNMFLKDKEWLNSVYKRYTRFYDKAVSEISDKTNLKYKAQIDELKNNFIASTTKCNSKYDLDIANVNAKRDVDMVKLNAARELAIKTVNDSISKLTETANDSRDEITAKITKLKSDTKFIRDEIAEASKSYDSILNDLNARYSVLESKTKTYESGRCPECDTDLSDESHVGYLHDMNDEMVSIEVKIEDTSKDRHEKINSLNDKIDIITQKIDELTKSKNKIDLDYGIKKTELKAKIDAIHEAGVNKVVHIESENKMSLERLKNDKTEALSSMTAVYKDDLAKINNAIANGIKIETDSINSKSIYARQRIWNTISVKDEKMHKDKHEIDKKISAYESDITKSKTSLIRTDSDLDLLTMDLVSNDAMNSMHATISKLTFDKDIVSKKLNEVNEKLNTYISVKSILEPSGIKKHLIGNAVPLLNSTITRISEKFNYKYDFGFNDSFDPYVRYMGLDVDLESISGGEDKKMDLIVILSMLELIKGKHPNMNLLFLDEIFNALSISSIKNTVRILRDYVDRLGITIFVISHTPVPMEFFDRCIEVKCINGFSEIITDNEA